VVRTKKSSGISSESMTRVHFAGASGVQVLQIMTSDIIAIVC